MKAEDTVMSLEQLEKLEESEDIVAYDPYVGIEPEELRKVALAQAKISWKEAEGYFSNEPTTDSPSTRAE